MRITEEFLIFWGELRGGQKMLIAAAAGVIAVALIGGWATSFRAWRETRSLETEANHAKEDAKAALEKAANIAQEKLEAERKLAELEAKIDGRETELEKEHLESLDARGEYERTLRNRRGDNPSAEQLCAELAALGYPCS